MISNKLLKTSMQPFSARQIFCSEIILNIMIMISFMQHNKVYCSRKLTVEFNGKQYCNFTIPLKKKLLQFSCKVILVFKITVLQMLTFHFKKLYINVIISCAYRETNVMNVHYKDCILYKKSLYFIGNFCACLHNSNKNDYV